MTNPQRRMLFTDGSVNTKSKLGYGAYLIVDPKQLAQQFELSEHKLASAPVGFAKQKYKPFIQVKRFEQTSSTMLELQTLIWALHDPQLQGQAIEVHTDSQNIINLPARRNRLEASHYLSRRNKTLAMASLYRQFFTLMSSHNIKLVKHKGHVAQDRRVLLDEFFALVDQAARFALRHHGD